MSEIKLLLQTDTENERADVGFETYLSLVRSKVWRNCGATSSSASSSRFILREISHFIWSFLCVIKVESVTMNNNHSAFQSRTLNGQPYPARQRATPQSMQGGGGGGGGSESSVMLSHYSPASSALLKQRCCSKRTSVINNIPSISCKICHRFFKFHDYKNCLCLPLRPPGAEDGRRREGRADAHRSQSQP